ncbi:MAG: beta-N-acetylhexosaminidase [Gammaproteobacteria bacterium]
MAIGPVMLDLEGINLTDEERKLLNNPLVGGVIFFARNYESPEQIANLDYAIRDCRSEPILIAVDQEGGRVQRFINGFTRLPALANIGDLYDNTPEKAMILADQAGWLMAIELLAVGIDISFAPVLDLRNEISTVIGNRSFHSSPEVVTSLAKAYINGMNRAGMQAVGKHFPGHGSVAHDSHHTLPIDERGPEELLNNDLIPFTKLARTHLAGVMTAHVLYNKLDSNLPTFSTYWLQNALRKSAGFNGVIFSDDLTMAGAEIAGDYYQRSIKALTAGCDMILICNNRTAALEVLEKLEGYQNPISQQRLLKLCGRFQYTRSELQFRQEWKEISTEIKEFDLEAVTDN